MIVREIIFIQLDRIWRQLQLYFSFNYNLTSKFLKSEQSSDQNYITIKELIINREKILHHFHKCNRSEPDAI